MPKQTVTMTLRSSCQSPHQNHGEGFFTEYGGYVVLLENAPPVRMMPGKEARICPRM